MPMQPELEPDADSLKRNLLEFAGLLVRKDPAETLHQDGSKTMGGAMRATTDFGEMLAGAYDPLPNDCRQAAAKAVGLAHRIVTTHHFHDGNGRMSMYFMYLWMANFKFKFAIKPRYLHAFIYTEDQRDEFPPDLVDVVIAFTTDTTVPAVKSHLKHVKQQLITLEDDRKHVKELAKRTHSSMWVHSAKNPEGLLGQAAARDLWTKNRAVINQIAKYMNLHRTPATAFQATKWLSKMVQKYGDENGKVSADDVTKWLTENVKPALAL